MLGNGNGVAAGGARDRYPTRQARVAIDLVDTDTQFLDEFEIRRRLDKPFRNRSTDQKHDIGGPNGCYLIVDGLPPRERGYLGPWQMLLRNRFDPLMPSIKTW